MEKVKKIKFVNKSLSFVMFFAISTGHYLNPSKKAAD